MVTVERLTESSEEAIRDINLLLPQLRQDVHEHKGSLADLQRIVEDKDVALVVAYDEGHIVGMATLYMITKFGKRTGFVEDVVVDASQRGKGLGKKILQHLIDFARAERVKTLHLTSRPDRIEGNKLYQKLGFEIKETNPYRLKL